LVYYQPQIDLKTGRISGFEALIRWNSPLKGMISPMEFIPIAEETGLIIPIGEWVLHTACKQTKLWQDEGYYPFNIAINLSAKQFRQANLVEIINNIIVETGINPKDVELEITETMAMENINDTIKILDKLKNNGITIALDDFGTGYSSLNYLKKLPIDILKIDKDFIYDIADQQNQDEIVNIIISLAHSMNLKVVAEGVETVDKLNFLKQHNCDKVQGYYFSKPLNKEDTENLLKSNMIFKVTKD
jgi:EAL domain-containing protein (putative c-di-GMP-specific phosphodiesterase class I)